MRRVRRVRLVRQVLEGAHMTVGLRNETGTIELLTPHSESQPHFSYPLPLTDEEVRGVASSKTREPRVDCC